MTVSPLNALVARLESVEALDGPGRTAGRTVRGVIPDAAPKDVLSGARPGHALHPIMTGTRRRVSRGVSGTTRTFSGGAVLLALGPSRAEAPAGEEHRRDEGEERDGDEEHGAPDRR